MPAKPPFAGPEWIVGGDAFVRAGTGDRWAYNQEQDQWRWTCSDDQWRAVLATVPKLSAQADLDAARADYNQAASDYLALVFYHRARFVEDPPVLEWRKQCKYLEATLEGITRENQPIFWLDVSKALHFAKAAVVACEMEGSTHKGRRSPERDWLNNRLLGIWTTIGGKLTTGRSSNKETGKRVANSPAIRFLLAALAPILKDDMIGADAAEKIIKAEIKRQKQMPKMVESWIKRLNAMKKPTR